MRNLTRHPIETIARVGYGARGVVYALVGGLALLAALGTGGQTGGSRSALATVLSQPLGQVWLVLIALGLLGFCIWRILESLTDADRHGTGLKGITLRMAHFVSGLVYCSLALSALGLAIGWSAAGGEDQAARDWTAWLLAKPFGRWLVGLAGVGVAGAGLAFAVKAWRGKVTRYLSCPSDKEHWVVLLGRMGFAARAVVFLMIGGFVILAALRSSSSEVRGLGGALQSLQQQPYGWVLLSLTAIGLFAFGLFGLVQARYRHIDPPDLDDAKAALIGPEPS